MSYKILVLPANSSIDIELARKIEQLIQKGGVVIGSGFKGSAGLDQLNVNDDVIRISKSLFGIHNANGKYEKAERKLGKGKVFTGYDINEVLQLQNIVKDISWPEGEQKLMWIHRRDKADQCYFISNQSNDKKVSQLSFRVFGLLPELYNPETGIMIPAPIWAIENGKTNITLSLEEYGSVFVIFRKSTIAKHGIKKLQLNSKEVNFFNFLFTKNSKNFLRLKELGNYQLFLADNKVQQKIQSKKAEIKALNSNWEVSFEENRGAPIQAKFDKLISYVDSSEKGIQYFSGKAIYRKDFSLSIGDLSNEKAIFIDLGIVKNIATLIVNGSKVRTFWKPPFASEITSYCKEGNNLLEVEVTNLWPNRLIGDEAEPEDLIWGKERSFSFVTNNRQVYRNLQVIPEWVKQNKDRPSKNRITFSTVDFFDKDDPLFPSGLLGPVNLTIEELWKINI